MINLSRSSLFRYSFAGLAVFLTIFLKLLLSSAIGGESPFGLLGGAIAVSAWYGGLDAGILATVLAALCGDYFFVGSAYSLFGGSGSQWLALGLFLLEAGAIVGAIVAVKSRRADPLRQVAENCSQALWIADRHLREIFYVSPKYEQLCDRGARGFYDRPDGFVEAIHPEDRDRAMAALERLPDGECEAQYRLVRPDGSIRWVQVRMGTLGDRAVGEKPVVGLVEDITATKQREIECEQANARFQIAAKAVNCVIYEWDLETNQVQRSESLYELLGYRPEEVEATKAWWRSRIHPEDLSSTYEQVQNALANDRHFDIEYRLRHKNEGYLYVSDRGAIARNAEGKAVRVIGCTLDISKDKQIEAELQNREKLFRTSVENLLDCFGIYSAIRDSSGEIVDFKIDYVNAAACINNKLTREEQIGKNLCEILPAHRESGLFEEYRPVVETGEPLVKESIVYEDYPGESSISGAFDIRAVRFGDGFVATWRDISDRKRTEEELSRREREFKALVEHSPDIVARLDRELRHLYVSPAIEAVTGISAQDFIGKTHADLGFSAEKTAEWEGNLQEIFATGCERVHEFDFSGPGGVKNYFQSRLIPEFATDGSVESVLAVTRDVTDFKRSQMALLESEERLRMALEGAKLGLWTYEIDRETMLVSEESKRLFGLEEETSEIELERVIECLHADDRERVRRAMSTAIAQQQDYDIEYRIIWPDSTWRWIAAKGRAYYDEKSRATHMSGVVLDITERKQAEFERDRLLKQLEFEQQLLKAVLQQMPAGALVAEAPSGKIILCNTQAEKIWHAPMPQSQNIEEYQAYLGFHPDKRPYEPQEWPMARALEGGEMVADEEIEIRRGDGEGRIVCVSAKPVRNLAGQLLAGVLTFYDITDRKQAERERERLLAQAQQARAAAEASEQKYRILAEAIPQMVWTARPDGWLDYCNQRWFDYTGLASEQSEGWGWETVLHPEDLHECVARWREAVATGEAYEIECRIQRGTEAEYRWHLARSLPLRDAQGQIVKWFGTFTDIHERKQVAAERAKVLEREQAARAQAESASRMKDEFLAIVSHELRTPLNAILGWARLLRSRNFDSTRTQKALEIIERNAQAQTQLIEDLLDISRIIRGKVRLHRQAIDLQVPIEAAMETVRASAQAKQIQLQCELDAVGAVSGDSGRLQQIIWNLLSNAVKFTPDGGEVTVRLQQVGSIAQIQVIDTGKGIPPEFLPYVFDRFRQAESNTTRSHGGLGLGLAIVRNLVELHQGNIRADSEGTGRGTTFIVEFALVNEPRDRADGNITAASTDPGDASDALSGIKVLIVDDEPDARDFLVAALEEYGAQVTPAASTPEAIALLAQQQPTVLVSDIGMPGEDGYTLIRRVRALPPQQGGDIPAAALTAYAREEDRIRALSAGYQLHVPKPIQPQQLVSVVANLARKNG